MNKFILLFCFACLGSGVCLSQTTGSWYKLLKGKIDKYPVTMYLYRLDHNYTGYYYYDAKQDPIYFNGNEANNKIILTTSAEADQAETFILSSNDKNTNGTWQQGKRTALTVSLSEARMPVMFTYNVISDSAKLRPKLSESPQATVEATSVWPTGNSTSDEFIKTQIRKLFSDKQNSKNAQTMLRQYGKRFLAEYITTNKEATNNDLKNSSSMYAYDLSGDLHIDYQAEKIISFAFSVSTYTGGAHGNYGTSHVSVDLLHNKVIRLSDVLTPDGIRQLRPLLEKNFRKNYNLNPTEPLTNAGVFENKIEPNKNVYVTGKRLVFTYNPYEIASYATGAIELSIEYKDIQNYLLPAFKILLQ